MAARGSFYVKYIIVPFFLIHMFLIDLDADEGACRRERTISSGLATRFSPQIAKPNKVETLGSWP